LLGGWAYSVASHNREHLADLMADFARLDGRPLGERNVRPLDDEYLRFLRWSVWKLLDHPGAAGQGLIALVTNSAFLSRPVMRGVRRFLLDRFDEIRVLDLHGNRRNVFHGRRDENVFRPVKVGISITLFIRYPDRTNDPARVFYRETRGSVPDKFAYLDAANVGDDGWQEVTPAARNYTFLPKEADADYASWPATPYAWPREGQRQ